MRHWQCVFVFFYTYIQLHRLLLPCNITVTLLIVRAHLLPGAASVGAKVAKQVMLNLSIIKRSIATLHSGRGGIISAVFVSEALTA